MDGENGFSYTYSAPENREVLAIRSKYLPKEQTPMEQLKSLDAQISNPASVFACTYGSVSAVIMGAGMSLVMTDIGAIIGLASAMVPGIAIGVAGMCMALTTYPIYKRVLENRKRKFAPEILKLSEKIMKG